MYGTVSYRIIDISRIILEKSSQKEEKKDEGDPLRSKASLPPSHCFVSWLQWEFLLLLEDFIQSSDPWNTDRDQPTVKDRSNVLRSLTRINLTRNFICPDSSNKSHPKKQRLKAVGRCFPDVLVDRASSVLTGDWSPVWQLALKPWATHLMKSHPKERWIGSSAFQ